ncbi:hypothetical protein GPECTOR_226g500 [Gonium pectorale]|uniref:Ankyrin repeat domain-containing protein n=1 Tax=Gonium pectorale TaxID=33097 RepID=A0A150FXU4_GONPE|nr:hypothetical protein GPECTOR_226g500 [Gonium pectorale]|eukprot:KXZ42005.1 hypothetical protein GPECTOR_226g500 [Gonium pectorale]
MGACQWLRERIGACDVVLAAAAGGGHAHLCEWLLASGTCTRVGWHEVAGALRAGNVSLAEWLLQRMTPELSAGGGRLSGGSAAPADALVPAAAEGCDLPTLQRTWERWGPPSAPQKCNIIAAAIRSATPDWAAKVEWLESQGCPRNEDEFRWCKAAAARPDAPARLAWLRDRGYPLDISALHNAAEAGSSAALVFLLTEVGDPAAMSSSIAATAAQCGHVSALQVLHGAGCLFDVPHVASAAATRKQLRALVWLVETFGVEAIGLEPQLFHSAAWSGSVKLMAWLRERGCAWDSTAYSGVAASGCEVALEWLVAAGCPVPADGSAYKSACTHCALDILRCFLALGFPWGPDGDVFCHAVLFNASAEVLRWLLLEAGCPVSYGAARAAAAGEPWPALQAGPTGRPYRPVRPYRRKLRPSDQRRTREIFRLLKQRWPDEQVGLGAWDDV